VIRLFVPGRLEVFGKHTDYAGGLALVAAVPRGFTVSAVRTGSGRVTVADAIDGARAEFTPEGEGPAEGWRRYPATVIRRLAANFPRARLSAEIVLESNLPQEAGISSSSALVIAVAEALIACAGIEEQPEWRAAIRSPEDRAAYFGCIENGSPFGPLAGDAGVGTHGGSEDHAAILLARESHLLQCSFSPLRCDRHVRMPAGWTFVIACSGVAAPKTGAARDAYNALAEPAAMTGGRLTQFAAENERVRLAAEAFAAGDIAGIRALAAASQADADRWLRNQVPATRDLVALALERGAAAASSFGAGWGGSVWALTETSGASSFLGAWLAAYRSHFPDLPSSGFIAPPSAGVRLAR
jgi:galactokinase